jgi:hypothetical protein
MKSSNNKEIKKKISKLEKEFKKNEKLEESLAQ